MLVLASASEARQELLRRAGVAFVARPAGVRELRGRGRTLRETVLENARRKAAAAMRHAGGAAVLAADTLVAFEGRLLGKPSSRAEAAKWLTRMAGRTHVIATGVVLREDGRVVERYVESKVRLRALDAAGVRRLLDGYDPTKYAGGYAIQRSSPGELPRRLDDPLVEAIEGSLSNVIGLPMEAVLPMLGRDRSDRRAAT